jgi:sugar lactone lactonase YvrE
VRPKPPYTLLPFTQSNLRHQTWNGGGYTQSTVATGLGYPTGVAIDGAGNIYIADQDNFTVYKETPSSGGGYTQSIVDNTLGTVAGIAVDGAGNVYVGRGGIGIEKETLSGGSYIRSEIFYTFYAYSIAVDASGNLYFATENGILKETPTSSGYVQSTVGTISPLRVAVDGLGNVYGSIGFSNGGVWEEQLAGGSYVQTLLPSNGNDLTGLAVDGAGNVYLSSASLGDVWEISSSNPPVLHFAATAVGQTSTDSPQSLTIENAGNAALNIPIPSQGSNPSIPAGFTVNDSGASACPLIDANSPSPGILAVGASCAYSVSFSPQSASNTSGWLALTFDAPNEVTPNYLTENIPLIAAGAQLTPSITWATPAAIPYGTALSGSQLNATASVPGTYAYSPAAGTVLAAGPQTLEVTFTPTDSTDFTTATATVTLTVNKAAPAITWATPTAITAGTALSATQLNASSTVAGSFGYTPAAGTVLGAGQQTLTVTFTPTDTTDYTTATATVVLTVNLAPPVISPASGTYTSAQTVTITDTTPGATIYYEGIGAVQTSGYVPYTGPITLSANGYEYIYAYAVATGSSQSSTTYAYYTISLPNAAAPVITPASGTSSSNQTITITDTTPGATIYYSATGPVSTSGYVPYTGPITVSGQGYEYIDAYATATGYSQSSYAIAYYDIIPPAAATPVITPAGGTYNSAQTVTITDSTPGTTIYYSASGSAWTIGFVQYTGPIAVSGEGEEIIEAYAMANGYSPSATATVTYTIYLPPAPTPVISLASGAYPSAQTVTITDTAPGATIYYTTNGSEPTTGSAQYTGPITVSSSETLAASALASGYWLSVPASAQYIIDSTAASFIYTIAGDGFFGYSGDNGPATAADVNAPAATVLDSAGNLYIADSNNHVIRKVAAGTGVITTVAGNGTWGYSGDNGPATSAQLDFPMGVALDSAGNLYIADTYNNVIRMVSATTGVITTFAGSGATGYGGDNGPATGAELGPPAGIAFDSAGDLYIAIPDYYRVRKIAAGTGTLTTVAGNGQYGYSGDNGPATSAMLGIPRGVALDGAGNLYIADQGFDLVRKVNAQTSVITTVAGTPPATSYGPPNSGYSGDGGPATSARLTFPYAVAVDGAGNFYIADYNNQVIRKVTASTGIISTVVGDGNETPCSSLGGDGGPATSAALCNPEGVTLDGAGNLYIADSGESRIREATVSGPPPTTAAAAPVFSVPAGTYVGTQTVTLTDSTPGAAIYVTMNGATPSTLSPMYNGPISVTGAVTIQAVAVAPGYLASAPVTAAYTITTPPTAVISTVAGNGTYGLSGIGGPATSAEIGYAEFVTLDGTGNLYFSDPQNEVVWMVAAQTGTISVVAGNGTYGYSGDNGPATSAQLHNPTGVAVDSAGNLYIADYYNDVIRKVTASTGVITTIAGTYEQVGSAGQIGDGGPASAAYLDYPSGLALDNAGNLYIADSNHGVVRRISASSGIITTVAGMYGQYSYSGDGGPATSAGLGTPNALAFDSAGNLYISSSYTARVRKVAASTGVITTVAGNGDEGVTGDGGLAVNAEINPPGIAVDSAGNLYISNWPGAVREVAASTGIITRIAGNGYFGYSGDGGSATVAEIAPQGIAFDSAGNLYIADAGNYRVRKVTFPGPAATPAFGLAAGTYVGAQSVAITDTMQGATIYYTTDGSTPTTGSSVYSSPVAVSASETLQAIAVVTGYTESAVASAAFTINQPVTPTITWATPAAITYGTALGAAQLDATSSVAGSFVYTPAAGTVLTAGSQTLSVAFTPNDTVDYTPATATVTISVNQVTPSIAWVTPAAITYGTALSATQLNATSSVAGSFVYTPAAGTVLTAGSHTLSVTFTPTDTTDYNTANSSVTLAVNKAAPAITWATPGAINYGTALSATQLNASSTVAGSFAYNPAAGTVLTAGSQTLSVTFTPTDATDYATANSSVTLAVNKAVPAVGVNLSSSSITMAQTLTVTVAVSGASGASTPSGTVTLAGGSYSAKQTLAAGSATFNLAAGTLPVGAYTLTATYTPDSAGASNYTSASQTASLTVTPPVGAPTPTVTVTPAEATITNQQSDTVTVSVAGSSGQPTPTGTVNLASGSYNAQQTLASGSASFTIAAGTLGSGANTLTASYSGDGNYGAASGTASVTVAQATITVPAPASITPGASGTSTGTISAGSTYSGTLDLTCSLTGSPSGAVSLPTCGLSPAAVTLISGGNATTVFTVNTTAASTTALNRPAGTNLWRLGGGGAALAALLFFGIPARRRRWITMAALLMAFIVVGAIGCGGHGSSSSSGSSTPATTAGNYTFTITGTDSVNAKITTSTAVTVTVQ